jgi:stress response protein YsnF
MQNTVIGIFRNPSDARHACDQLRSAGFAEHNVDIVTGHTGPYSYTDRTSQNAGASDSDSPYGVTDESRYNDNIYRDSESAARKDNLNEDRIYREEVRNEHHDSGFGESIGRFFRNLFDNKEEAEKYTAAGQRNAIVSVYTSSAEESQRAAEVMDRCGAIDLDEQSEDRQSHENRVQDNLTESDAARDLRAADVDRRDDLGPEGPADGTIPVIEEDVNIGKREVERGGVRVRARIVERPVEENLRLREEHLRVERHPVNRPATERDFAAFKEGEIEITESAEVPVVDKETRVVEEVRLNKDVTERDETVRDTVKGTDVDIEKISQDELRSRKRRDKNK